MCDNNKSDLIRKAKNEYHNEWQRQNKEKVRQSQNRYWEKKAKQNTERNKK